MKKGLYFVVFILFVCAACKSSSNWTDLDKEADREGERYWKSQFLRCGDSYFATYRGQAGAAQAGQKIVEVRELTSNTIRARDEQLTEADKLNGIEWEGATYSSCKAFRVYENGQWSKWHDLALFYTLFPEANRTSARKANGKWEFGESGNGPFAPFPCDQIPQ